MWEFLLWLAAVACVAAGIWRLFLGEILWGVLLIIAGLLIGPGGASILS